MRTLYSWSGPVKADKVEVDTDTNTISTVEDDRDGEGDVDESSTAGSERGSEPESRGSSECDGEWDA